MAKVSALLLSLSMLFSITGNAQNLRIKHADVPEYPQLAVAARLGGTLHFRVEVDHGAVTSVRPRSGNPANLRILAQSAENNIRGWTFYDTGHEQFDVEFTYEISGEEELLPTNPRIEMNLPAYVKLIACPVKPTVNYEGRK